MRGWWRAAAAQILLPAFAGAFLIAPSHVHESDADHEAVMHRHLAAHHEPSDHTAAEIDHDDGRIVWMPDTVLPSAVHVVVAAPLASQVPGQVNLDVPRWFAIVSDDTALPHGPPRVLVSLRGPPRLSL